MIGYINSSKKKLSRLVEYLFRQEIALLLIQLVCVDNVTMLKIRVLIILQTVGECCILKVNIPLKYEKYLA